MKNYGEYFTVNMVLLTLLGIIIMPGIADTWFDGKTYIFRATSYTCSYFMFMAFTWAGGIMAIMERS